jgi:hypothetical protein
MVTVSSVADPHMDPHDFSLRNPHPESTFHMRIPDVDADPNPAMKFVLLTRSSISCYKKLNFLIILSLFKKSVYFKGTVQREFS